MHRLCFSYHSLLYFTFLLSTTKAFGPVPVHLKTHQFKTYAPVHNHKHTRPCSSALFLQNENKDSTKDGPSSIITSNIQRSILFSTLISICGAALGPFLDSYHSAFGVLTYEEPITAILWGTKNQPALITAWWVPELFGLAGFIIGWLYILLDDMYKEQQNPSPFTICVGISYFTFQYWLSGILYANGLDRGFILILMSVLAGIGFSTLDKTKSGFITSCATAIGGPVIEVVLLSILIGHGGYQYSDLGETGFFPLWIVPVYFLGGPAVGNLARGIWNALPNTENNTESIDATPCKECNDSRCVPCPNCDGVGYYITYGTKVTCNCCKGRGLVICRACFSKYDEDPADIEAVRALMRRMPD